MKMAALRQLNSSHYSVAISQLLPLLLLLLLTPVIYDSQRARWMDDGVATVDDECALKSDRPSSARN